MKREKFLHEQQRFSMRKYSFGAASVLLGASLVFAGQALADEHHEVSTPSNASLFATSDSDAVTAADIFSGVATDGQHQVRKLAKSQQLAKPLVKLLRVKLVLVPHKQQIKFLNQQLLAQKRQGTQMLHLKKPLTLMYLP